MTGALINEPNLCGPQQSQVADSCELSSFITQGEFLHQLTIC